MRREQSRPTTSADVISGKHSVGEVVQRLLRIAAGLQLRGQIAGFLRDGGRRGPCAGDDAGDPDVPGPDQVFSRGGSRSPPPSTG